MARRINMKGYIGEDFSGHYISSEIDYFADKEDRLDLYINSLGGNVDDANSIMGSIHSSKVPVDGYNMGFAFSSAFQVFLSCKDLYAVDYARFGCHDPSIVENGKKIEDLPEDDEDRKALEAIRDQIAEIISNRGGVTVDKALSLMKENTWFTVDQMNDTFGLNIKTLNTKRQPNVKKNATILEFVNIISNFNPEIVSETKTPEMEFNVKPILNALKIRENIANPETEIANAITVMNTELVSLREQKSAWDTKKTEFESRIKTLEDAAKVSVEDEANKFVDALVEEGLIREEGKENIKTLYLNDPENTKKSFGDNLLARVTNGIDPSRPSNNPGSFKLETFTDSNGNKVTKDWDWYAKHEPHILEEGEAQARAGQKTEVANKFRALWKSEYEEDFDKANSIETSKSE